MGTQLLQLTLNGLITGSVITLGAVGVSIVLATLDIGTMMHGDYMAFGAYVAFGLGLATGANIVVSFLLGAGVTALLAVLVDFALLRPFRDKNVDATLILTLGVALSLRAVTYLVAGGIPRRFNIDMNRVFVLGSVRISLPQLINLGVATVAIVAVALILSRTILGKSMRAMANDRELASIAGINIDRMRIYVWLFAAFFGGLAGALLAVLQAAFTPEVGWNVVFLLFTAVILGGVGSVYGTLIGGMVLGLAMELSAWSGFFGGLDTIYKPAVGFVIMLAVLLLRPQGILGRARLL